MQSNRVIVTFLMFNLLSTPVYASQTARPANADFTPVSPVVYSGDVSSSQNVQAVEPVQEVMFYIPVYTMKIKQTAESQAVVPVQSKRGNNVIMPIYNHVNVQKNKSAVNPSSLGSSGVNNPVLNPVPPQQQSFPGIIPSNPNSSAGNNAGTGNGSALAPVLPDNSVSSSPISPDLTPTPVNPSQTVPQNINTKKSQNIVAAAPIVIIQGANFRKGTKLKVKSCDELTSKDGIYKRIEFETIEPVSTTYATIPIGTKVKGEIVKIEEPKSLGRGASVTLIADKMTIEEETFTVDGIVTKTDESKVFFNKVKAPGTYKKEMAVYTSKGKDYYKKMALKSQDYAASPKTFLLAPFPYIAGAAGVVSHALVSPFAVLNKKGADVYVAEGTEYELKFDSDCSLPVSKNKVGFVK